VFLVSSSRIFQMLLRYLNYLYNQRRIAQLAWYTSQLSANIQSDKYADFLTGVLLKDDRELCLTLGYEHNLPMEEMRRLVVEKTLERSVI